MGIYIGPKLVTDGLIAYFDAANNKSYEGRNLLFNTENFIGWTNTPDGLNQINKVNNATISPIGDMTATEYMFNVVGKIRCSTIYKTSVGEKVTFSIYAKSKSGNSVVNLSIGDQGFTNFTIGSTEWVRINITIVKTNLYNSSSNYVDISAIAGTNVYLWGAQFNYGDLIEYYPIGFDDRSFNNLVETDITTKLINGPFYRANKIGVIYFDGVNDMLETNTDFKTTEFSINLNIKRLNETISYSNLCNIFNQELFLLLETNGGVTFRPFINDSYFNSGYAAKIGQWTDICIVLSKTHRKIFMDGVLRASNLLTNPNQEIILKNFSITSLSRPSSFELGQFKIYNRALTDNEVLQNFMMIKSRHEL